MRLALLALVVLLAGAAPAGASHLSFALRSGSAEVSSNWSGYALTSVDETAPLAFEDVTGTWAQPKAKCTVGRRDASAFWVGLGGYDASSTSLEQLGTAAECTGNSTTPNYSAWWELVPAASVTIPFPVRPGDRMIGAVLVHGQTITFSLRDVTRQWRFSKVLTTKQALDVGSAEWIAEAPSECSSFNRCNVVPLTNFGTMTFTNAATIANAHPGTLVDPTWLQRPIELITRSGGTFGTIDTLSGVGAVPGDVSADGRTFSVSWQQNLAP